ncbi:MAG: hypothetical protein AB7I32_05340 [Gammaproteobacteria bacterium]
MKTVLPRCSLGFSLGLLCALPVHAATLPDLVSNGSMEFVAGKPADWTLLNPSGEFWNTFNPGNRSADGGSYFGIQDLDAFAPRQNARGLSQEIEGLVVGSRYTLTFESNEEHTNPNFLAQWQVSFGDETRLSTLTDTTWVTDVMHFTATNTTQTLQFVATYLPGALPQILNLDGVHLSADPVPLPATGWLLVPALVGLLRVTKKRTG